jgi:hypothetical protein
MLVPSMLWQEHWFLSSYVNNIDSATFTSSQMREHSRTRFQEAVAITDGDTINTLASGAL